MGKMTSKSISLLTLGLVCALGILGSMRLANRGFETNAATVQTNQRVYVYLEGGWDTDRMFIHYWGGASGSTWASCPEMTQVVGDYWTGLFYFDLSMDTTTFCVKNVTGDVSINSNQSVNILVSDLLVAGNYKAVAIGAWVANGTNRTATIVDNCPGNSGQIANVLAHINSCSSSYASGYNAWPQLNDLFISPSTLNLSETVLDQFGENTTIGDKKAWLETKYTLDHA